MERLEDHPQVRWRLVLVRHPSGLLLPDYAHLKAEQLPAVVQEYGTLNEANLAAARLREQGAAVTVDDGSARCPEHPAEHAAMRCRVCETPLCHRCQRAAHEQPLCPRHARAALRRLRLLRLRQLFLLFLLVALIYLVVDFIQADRARIFTRHAVKIALIQFILPEAEGAPIIDILNSDGPGGLNRIQRWYNAEHARYTNDADYIELSVLRPKVSRLSPPSLGGPGDSMFSLLVSAWRYQQYFSQLGDRNGVRAADVGARVFVIVGAGNDDLAAHSRGSQSGRLAISYIDAREQNPAYALATIAHEMGHTLGADDTYHTALSTAVHPRGFVEPFADPLYPQRFAELMAVDIPLGPGIEGEIRDLNQLRVGYHSAAQMGWIDPDEARLYYAPFTPSPEQKLPLRPMDSRQLVGGAAPEARATPPPDRGSGEPAPADDPGTTREK
ncbi:MAG: hypothetical protein AAFV53_17365 [Myxococcota bacterium]